MKSIWDKWKLKWNIESDLRMVWIFVIFTITGTCITFVRKLVTGFLFDKTTYGQLNWYEWIFTILAVYILYQCILFIVGTILGEHKFVKWFVIKMNKRFLVLLKK